MIVGIVAKDEVSDCSKLLNTILNNVDYFAKYNVQIVEGEGQITISGSQPDNAFLPYLQSGLYPRNFLIPKSKNLSKKAICIVGCPDIILPCSFHVDTLDVDTPKTDVLISNISCNVPTFVDRYCLSNTVVHLTRDARHINTYGDIFQEYYTHMAFKNAARAVKDILMDLEYWYSEIADKQQQSELHSKASYVCKWFAQTVLKVSGSEIV